LRMPLTFTGNGTAFYAAVMGSQVLSSPRVDIRAVQAFELVNYEPAQAKGTVIGVSHSGITKGTVDALRKWKSTGSFTVALTHFPGRPISEVADHTIVIGNGPDKSRCHTKAYTDSAAAVAALTLGRAMQHGPTFEEIRKELVDELGAKLARTLDLTEAKARDAARELSTVKRVYLVGAGPNLVTVREAALKIKETSYLPAEGMELEEFQHGPWMVLDKDTLVVVAVPDGPSRDRAGDLLKAAKRVGSRTLVVSDAEFEADYAITVPRVPEAFSPFLMIVPLYFLSYFLAVERGNNPDYLRYLDPNFWGARLVIFPPGTH
jgi:glutamine---fructose-6-phosphate transaminase (isomerizing)